MKNQLQIHLFIKDNLVIVIPKKYTLIILSIFLNIRENFQKKLRAHTSRVALLSKDTMCQKNNIFKLI
jgi:hypothetical protein